MQFVDNADWSQARELAEAAYKGFDMDAFVEDDIKQYIKKHTNVEYELGMCPRGRGPDDVNKWADLMTAVGWRFLTTENFGAKNLKEFRENLPLRFHPTVEADGRLRYRNRWIMYMRKDVRTAQINAQADAAYGSLAAMSKHFEAPDLDEARAAKGLAPGDERVAAFGSPLEIEKVPASEFGK